MRCNDCETMLHPPYPVCRKCLSENVAPYAVPGTGEIYSLTINHQKWNPALEVPFVIARVAIDGAPGVLLTTNIVGSPVESVQIGDRVRVRFEQQDEIYFLCSKKYEARLGLHHRHRPVGGGCEAHALSAAADRRCRQGSAGRMPG